MRCNRDQLADLLGYDVKTIDRMVASGMPYLKRPGQSGGRVWQFDTGAVWKWATGRDTPERLKEVKRRMTAAKATIREIELAEKSGLLVHVHDVANRVAGGDTIVKSRLQALPGRVAHLVAAETDPAKVHDLLRREFDDALGQLDLNWKDRG